MSEIIEASNLSKSFNGVTAVKELSFSVNEGDVYGFLGQNGAGKSTTIRMLLTLIAPTRGEVKMFGLDLGVHRKEILRRVGAVIEKPDVYKYLTAYQNLELFSKISGGKSFRRSEYLEQLETVGLAERAFSKVKTFSQGMKQRLGIAIALVHEPELIILDEPTNGLDPQGIADIRNLILHLSRDKKKTILVSSHLLSEIQLIANRLLIIHKGKKIVEGSTNQFFDPANTLVELETVDNETTLKILQSSNWSKALEERKQKNIVLRIRRDEVPEFNKDLVNMGVEVISIQPRHSLEDYFLQVTTGNQHVESFAN